MKQARFPLSLTSVVALTAFVACGGSNSSDIPTPTPITTDGGSDVAASPDGPADSPAAPLDAPADFASEATGDGAVDAPGDGPPPIGRSMRTVALFGGTSAANLLIDPKFENGQFGVGRWNSGGAGTFTNALQSDAPDGIALPVGLIGDPTGANAVSLSTEIPGGRGPFRARVWISTVDAAASKDCVALAALSVIAAADESFDASGATKVSKSYDLTEDVGAAVVFSGHTWHRMTVVIPDSIVAGVYFNVGFRASKNAWMLQSPEFVPTELLKATAAATTTESLHRAVARPATAYELDLVRQYRARKLISVPASRLAKPRAIVP